MKLKIAICDDESQILEKEYEIIESVLKEKGLNYEIDKFGNAEVLFNACTAYHMAFLDIEMGDIDGIKVASRLKEFNKDCLVFFITNHTVYLDNALDINVHRYLTKPLDRRRLSMGVDSGLNRIKGCSKTIRVTDINHKLSIDLKLLSVIYLENSSRHTHIVAQDYDFIAKEPYSELKLIIGKEVNYFADANQSVFVNLNYINRYENGIAILRYADKINKFTVSRRRQKIFTEKIFEFGKGLK